MLENCIQYKRFVWELDNVLNIRKVKQGIIFLCIGTNTIIGDAFGPIVGSVLKKNLVLKNNLLFNNIKILGDVNDCISYDDLNNSGNYLEYIYQNNVVVVLDSALSCKKNIGKIFIQNRGLKFAESLKKSNSVIGNISIKAVVGENVDNSYENFNNLRNASIDQVKQMCKLVSIGIIDVMNKKKNNGKNIYK